jgi:hypothetical protein
LLSQSTRHSATLTLADRVIRIKLTHKVNSEIRHGPW